MSIFVNFYRRDSRIRDARITVQQLLFRNLSKVLNSPFTTISRLFLPTKYMNIFHKTEVQTVILRYCTGLFLNWCKSYDKNEKHTKNTRKHKINKNSTRILFFLQNRTKRKMEKIAFCVITFEPIKIQTLSAPQNDRLNFSFVKDTHVNGGNLA